MIKIVLPLYVILPRKKVGDKKFILNLNNYRNTFHMSLNEAKKRYKDLIKDEIKNIKKPVPPISCTYVLYPRTKQLTDLGNVLSIVQKFTEDALVEYGVIEDDNYSIITEVNQNFGEVDKENPRVELFIKEVERCS